jgi:hypothetical protein
MRVTAVMAGPAQQGVRTDADAIVGAITPDGTMFLVFFGTVTVGLAAGAVYAAARPWLPARWAGGAFALLALAAGGSHLIEARNPDFAGFGSPVVNVAMYVALFLLGGYATHWCYGRLARFRGSRVSAVLGLLALGLVAPAIFGIVGVPTDAPALGVPGPTALLVGAVAAALVIQIVMARRKAASLDNVPAWMGPRLMRAGQVAGAIVIATGLWSLVREVALILGTNPA